MGAQLIGKGIEDTINLIQTDSLALRIVKDLTATTTNKGFVFADLLMSEVSKHVINDLDLPYKIGDILGRLHEFGAIDIRRNGQPKYFLTQLGAEAYHTFKDLA